MTTILIVDDELSHTDPYVRELEDEGYIVELAPTADDGMSMACAVRPDLILMDVRMKPEDGYAACLRLRSARKTRHIPVVMFTVERDHSAEEVRAYRVGAVEFWVKDTPQKLVKDVRKLLSIPAQ